MSGFTKVDLEAIYNTVLTENDFKNISEVLDGMTKNEISEDTRYFSSLNAYVQYRRQDESNFRTDEDNYDNDIIEMLVWIGTQEPNNLQKAEDILVDSEDIKLGNGRYILIMG